MLSWDSGISRLTVIGIVVCAMGLSACGRRAALDPPPNAAAVSAGQNYITPGAEAGEDLSPDKPFALDFLI